MTDTREVNKQIANLIKEAEAKISEAEALAKEYKLSFSWSGPAYGMGGYYDGDWETSNCEGESGWNPSSSSC
ncbi:MAG: hypothetical protein PHC28_05835 [Flavobacterium sp.]|uniref:hypothetical protein n=1 Tax=Flavobacterium sp. TaxID=239 RepID=UPI0026216DF2|nr:hypothetical protein [Flavobacterium sp.]MDD5149989.1 hypothetical protein [Flavobacterium sp.]